MIFLIFANFLLHLKLKMGICLFIFGLVKKVQFYIHFGSGEHYPSCIYLVWDCNSRPLDRESPLVTTRPGLESINKNCSVNLW